MALSACRPNGPWPDTHSYLDFLETALPSDRVGRSIMREFKIGQYVYYQRHSAGGRFIVIRLLPQPKGEPRYIIRSEESPEREYTAEASELRKVQGGR